MGKRKRKANSTSGAPPRKKNKTENESENNPEILSAEAKMQLGYASDEDTNNNILMPAEKKLKKKKPKTKEKSSKPAMSKTQLKKLKKLEEKKVKQSKRSGLIESLKESQLSDEQLRLMRSTRNLGTKDTMRQKLRRALSYQRAGLESDQSVPLVKERILPDNEELEEMMKDKNTTNEEVSDHDLRQDKINENQSDKESSNLTSNEIQSSDSSQDVDSKLLSLEKLVASGKYSQQELLSKINGLKYRSNPLSFNSEEEEEEGEEQSLDSENDNNNNNTMNNTDGKLFQENLNQKSNETDKYQNWKTTEDLVAEAKTKDENKKEFNVLAPTRPRLFNFAKSQAEQYRSFNEILKTLESERMQKMKELGVKKQKIEATKFYVPVDRDPEIQRKRLELPVCAEEQIIMEKINENDVVIICGETGSGKTTQVPQFLYEAGYAHPEGPNPGLIGVTQPRRVAAVSTARRVSVELNKPFGTDVAYQIRYERNVSDKTRIKFMTDGILLKEVQTDFLLRKYSSILIDEAHERNVNTDILIGLLSRIVPLRRRLWQEQQLRKDDVPPEERIYPLKVVIMSATLRVDDFTQNARLFANDPPPVVNVDARQYPVTVHFSKKTSLTDYVQDAFTKIGKIHTRLPPGGILVFLTGKQEIEYLVNKLDDAFGTNSTIAQRLKEQQSQQNKEKEEEKENKEKQHQKRENNNNNNNNNKDNDSNNNNNNDIEIEYLMSDNEGGSDEDQESDSEEQPSLNVSIADMKEHQDEDDIEVDVNSEDESDDDEWERFNPSAQEIGASQPTALHVLPLYSMLSPQKQMRVFESPPEGHRLCIVATNVAETSLTIPGIRYVVDTGRQKAKEYDRTTGITSYEIRWTSKASADQRAGRAGRTGPGHCYRLYSSAVYDQRFEQFSDPELLNVPIDSTILQMKSMGINNIDGFPFPTPPLDSDVDQALHTLRALEAVSGEDSAITRLGQTLSMFPLHPRFAKMILLSKHRDCMPYIIAVVSALSAPEMFQLQPPQFTEDDDDDNNNNDFDENEKKKKKQQKDDKRKEELKRYKKARSRWAHEHSDLLAMLKAVGAYEFASKKDRFCHDNFLNIKSMKEVHSLRLQLCHTVSRVFQIDYRSLVDLTHLRPPSSSQSIVIRQIITAGYVDRVARRVPSHELDQIRVHTKIHKGRWPYVSMATGASDAVFIHPTSYLSSEEHEYIVYNDMVETSQVYMKGVTAIHPAWLPELGKPLVTYPKPLDQPAPKYSRKKDQVICFVRPTYGSQSWTLPLMDVELSDLGDKYKPVAIRVFARAFMEGKVLPVMKGFTSAYTTSPAHITRAMVGSTPKVDALVSAFETLDEVSMKSLTKRWKKDKHFLLKEFLMWMPISSHAKLKAWWPPMKSSSKS